MKYYNRQTLELQEDRPTTSAGIKWTVLDIILFGRLHRWIQVSFNCNNSSNADYLNILSLARCRKSNGLAHSADASSM